MFIPKRAKAKRGEVLYHLHNPTPLTEKIQRSGKQQPNATMLARDVAKHARLFNSALR